MATVTIDGAGTLATYKIASTFGTAVQGVAGDQLKFNSLTHGTAPTELTINPLGGGQPMLVESQQGALSPFVNIDMVAGYENAMGAIVATFFGADSSAIATDGYTHTITYDPTLAFGTIAFESASDLVIEYPSCYPSRIAFSAGNFPEPLNFQADFVCGDRELSTAVNTNANLASVTEVDTTPVIADVSDDSWLSTQADATFDSVDQVDIISFSFELRRGKRHSRQMKGSAGLSAPVKDGMFEGELTMEIEGLDTHTYLSGADAGTLYKSQLVIEGASYGTDNRTWQFNFPALKMIEDPEYNVTEPGVNRHTLKFKILGVDLGASLPTGMTDRNPYCTIINSLTTDYL